MLGIALRAHRFGLLAAALIGFVATFFQGAGFAAAAGHTPAERAAFGRSVELLAPQLAYLVPLPIHPETVAGYVLWRGYGFLPMLLAFWALMAATGAIRNEEERGLLEQWLAFSVGRVRLILTRFAAFTIVAIAAVLVVAAGTAAGIAVAGDRVDLARLAEQDLTLLGLTLACFSIALLAAQVAATRRGAAALGGIVLLGLFLLDSLARTRADAAGWGRFSPFGLYHMTTSLAPDGRFDGQATAVLFAVAVVLAALSTAAFWRRDLGAALLGRRRVPGRAVHVPSRNPLLRVPAASSLWEQRVGLLAWLVGTALLAAFMLSLSTSVAQFISSSPAFRGYLRAAGIGDPSLLMLGLFWFGTAALIVAVAAIVQVARWAADDAEGRLEMTLAQPVARWRVVVERAVTLAVFTALIGLAGAAVIVAGAPGQGIHLDGGNLAVATALLVLLALSFGALGAAIIARLPRVAVPVLSAVAVLGYLLQLIAPLFQQLPDWVLDFSLFRLYGTPLTSGVYWTGFYAMVGIVVAGFGMALLAMRTREVGR